SWLSWRVSLFEIAATTSSMKSALPLAEASRSTMGAITLLSTPATASTFRRDSTTAGRSLPALRSCPRTGARAPPTCRPRPPPQRPRTPPSPPPQLHGGREGGHGAAGVLQLPARLRVLLHPPHQVVRQQRRLRGNTAPQRLDDVPLRIGEVRDRDRRVGQLVD